MIIPKIKPKLIPKTMGMSEAGEIMPNFGHMRWKGSWTARDYFKNDVVIDTPFLMIANKDTVDRAAPQPSGPSAYLMPTTPGFSILQNTSVIFSGHKYTFKEAAWINAIRVWAPSLSATTNYRIVIMSKKPGELNPVYSVIEEPTLNSNAWTIVKTGSDIVTLGHELIVYLDALNSGANTQVTGGWTFGGQSNHSPPGAQAWNHNNDSSLLRVDRLDLNSVDRTSELLGMITGTIIQFVETANPQRSASYRVTDPPTDVTTHIDVPVIQTDQGIDKPTVGQTSTMTANVPVPLATDYVREVNTWISYTNPVLSVEGFLQFDGVTQAGNEVNGFGVDIAITPAAISPDWDFMSTY